MPEFKPYLFETHEGLPPDGEPGTYFGFDADGNVWLLRWQVLRPSARGVWTAIGFEAGRQFHPTVRLLREENTAFIVRWAAAPAPWSTVEGSPAEGE